MLTATISPLPVAMASTAPFWIAGWIIVLTPAIALTIRYTRKRRNRSQRSQH